MMTRLLKILEYAMASLLRRKGKTLGLYLVYAFTVAVLASVLFLTQSLRSEAKAVLQDAPDLVVQRLMAGRHALIPHDYIETIRKIPGVANASPRVWGYYYDGNYKMNFTLQGLSEETGQLKLFKGRLPEAERECAIGHGIAQTYGVEIGDSLMLADHRERTQLYRVSGFFETASALLTNDLILMPNSEIRRFFGVPEGFATDLAVDIHNTREISTITQKIKLALPDTRPISRSEILHTYDSVFNWRSGMMLSIFLAALAAFCVLAWDRASGLSAEEKREIGILKAIGWTTSDVLQFKFCEGLVVSLGAFLSGLILAFLHVYHFDAAGLVPVIKGWSVLFPKFQLIPQIDFYQISVLAGLTIVPYLASTLIPAWKSAIADPDSIMRG